LEDIFGREIVSETPLSLWLRLVNEFEMAKLSYKLDNSDVKSIMITGLISEWEKGVAEKKVSEYNERKNTNLELKRGLLRLPVSVFQELFEPMLTQICNHVG